MSFIILSGIAASWSSLFAKKADAQDPSPSNASKAAPSITLTPATRNPSTVSDRDSIAVAGYSLPDLLRSFKLTSPSATPLSNVTPSHSSSSSPAVSRAHVALHPPQSLPRGIYNLGNTCYMAAALQALASFNDLQRFLSLRSLNMFHVLHMCTLSSPSHL